MGYTVIGGAADRRVRADLDAICRELGHRYSDKLCGVYLTGSFGRGEGAVLCLPAPQPVKDFDILVVTAAPISSADLEAAGQSLVSMLGYDPRYFGVDITAWSLDGSTNVPMNLYGYEVMHGHQFLMGDDCLRRHFTVPDSVLTLETGRYLAFNRLKGLVYVSDRDLMRSPESPMQGVFLCHKIAEATLGLTTALLLAEGDYAVRYGDRAKSFRRRFPRKEHWADVVDTCVQLKLRPSIPFLAPLDLWNRVQPVLCEMFVALAEAVTGPTSADGVRAAVEAYERISHRLSSRKPQEELVAASIMLSLGPRGIDYQVLQFANQWLEQQGYGRPETAGDEWNWARSTFTRHKRGVPLKL